MAIRTSRAVRWVVGGAVVLVALAVGGPFVFIHFIEGPAPAKLTLPASKKGPGAKAGPGTGTTATSVDGVWKVGPGSTVGYRVQEVLLGQQATAVGRTSKVWGSLTITGGAVTKGSFTADMLTVVSDQSERNAQFDGRIMDVSAYPTATLDLAKAIHLSPLPVSGATRQYAAAGELTMHGVSQPVSFTVSAERSGTDVYVLADVHVLFARWGISNPSVAGFVTTHSSGTLEALLALTQGRGNPVVPTKAQSAGTSTPAGGGGPGGGGPPGGSPPGGAPPGGAPPGGSGGGGGGPVTVPATTLAPLTVPTR